MKRSNCNFCKKDFLNKYSLARHLKTCKKKEVLEDLQVYEKINSLDNKLKLTLEELAEKNKENAILKERCEYLTTQLNQVLKPKLPEILQQMNREMNMLRDRLETKRKMPRVKIEEMNVIYIITTDLLQTQRRYIFGKATKLTDRLSTYNKTDEHKIIYYRSCLSKEIMKSAEEIIFLKLSKYREKNNRERFILPIEKDISLFISICDEVIEYLLKDNEIDDEEIIYYEIS